MPPWRWCGARIEPWRERPVPFWRRILTVEPRTSPRPFVEAVPALRRELTLDYVVVNAENVAGGRGTLPRDADELFQAGVDLISGGNHTFQHRELYPYLEETPGSPPLLAALGAPVATASILVGPEGGWTDREREGLATSGWAAASLGPNVLRAETAAVAALAVVSAAYLAPIESSAL